jgi:Cdc6-like AAA superfamily ATPase
VAKFTVNQLRENALDVDYQYVNCWEDYSRFKTLYRLLDGIGKTIDIHRQSTPKDVLLERLREYSDSQYVAILDEVDQIEDKSLLYDLYRIQNLTMILIANREEDLFASLDDRLNSRLSSSARIRFGQYHDHELVAILEDRVRCGLADDAIGRKQLAVIADAAAGDARGAIGILRNAARTAARDRLDEIPVDVIEEAVPEAKSKIKRKNVEKLNQDQQVLYDIISETDEITLGDLYDQYQNRVKDPKTRRMVRNYLSELEHYNLISGKGATKGRKYRAIS